MKTIACTSCGTKYDATNLQAGVKFKCTNCGAVVQVPAGRAAPQAGGPVPVRRAAGPAGPMPGGRNPYMPPPRKGNTGAIVAAIVVIVVAGVVAIVAFTSGRPQPPQPVAAVDPAVEERRQAAAQRAEEDAARAAELARTLDAALAKGSQIESALRNEDRAALEGMFDWNLYATHIANLARQDERWLTYPLRADGSWEKGDDDRYTGRYVGTSIRSANSLRQRVMDYYAEYFFGHDQISFNRDRSAHENSVYSLEIGGTTYRVRSIYIDVGGSSREFYVGAPQGSTAVKIVYYNDGTATRTLRDVEARNERRAQEEEERRSGDGFYREGYDPSHRDPRRNPPPRPDDDRETDREEHPDDRYRPSSDENAKDDLPPLQRTGAMPTHPTLINAVREIERSGALNEARRNSVRGFPDQAQRKAVMGAFIDQLIHAVETNNRDHKHRISRELWNIWRSFVPTNWTQDDMTFAIAFNGTSTGDEVILRRWLSVYEEYEVD
jgi:hypothetical protein